MDVLTKLKGLSYLGWRNMAAAVRFGARRSLLEQRHARRRGPATRPGGLIAWEVTRDGARARFEALGARSGAAGDAGAPFELELRFLAPDLVRTTWTPGVAPVPYALAEREWDGVPVRALEDESGLTLTPLDGAADGVAVTVARDGGLRFVRGDGVLLREDPPPRRTGETWEARSRLRADESIHGLGERTAPFDLRGRTLRLWNREPKGAYGPDTDPIYLCVPVYVGVHAEGSYLAFHENSFDGRAAFGAPGTTDEARLTFEGGALRYYLVPGPLDRALRRYTDLTGRAPLPPRWALGFHQSRWSYMDAAEVRDVVRGFRERDLPLAAVHLDIHYMRDYRVFTIDETRFPDLGALAEEVGRDGVRLIPILDPALKVDPEWPLYREGLARGAYCRTPGGEPQIAPVWPGDAAFPDFTDPETRAWWADQYDALVREGAAGAWHDMNEPAAFSAWGDPTLPTPTRHAMEGRGGDHREAHNVYALLEARAGFEGLRKAAPERRPWILTRSGWAGIQRYAWTWTGDSETNWWSVAQSVRMALGLGLSGVPYSGPDIGGFGGRPDAEVFVRWFQTATFLPFFRVHSAFFTPRREPWEFGDEVLGIARDHLRLRERLLPYFYTLANEASETGAPLVRPLFWPRPDGTEDRDPALRRVDDAFLLGDALLVAPVHEGGATARAVRLPRGLWYELDGEGAHEGGRDVTLAAPLARIPVLVRAGSVVPMAEAGRLALHVWPPEPGHTGGGALYDDAGDGDGPGRAERYSVRREGATVVVERTAEGDFVPAWDGVDVVLHGKGRAVRRVEAGEFQRIGIGGSE